MTHLSDTFAGVVTVAMTLDPDALRDVLLQTHDRLPGGTQSSETGVRAPRMERCTDTDCPEGDYWDEETRTWQHSHPIPNDPTGDAAMKPSRSEADLRSVDHLEQRFVDAIGELATRSHSRGRPETWDEAVKDAHLLAEIDAVCVLENTWGAKAVRKWVEQAGDAVHDLELLAGRHASREPNDHERTWTSGLADEECCRVCLQLRLRVERHARGLCSGCWKLSQDSREHTDDGEPVDPPPELIEEFRRINNPSGPAWKAERSRWLRSLERRSRCA